MAAVKAASLEDLQALSLAARRRGRRRLRQDPRRERRRAGRRGVVTGPRRDADPRPHLDLAGVWERHAAWWQASSPAAPTSSTRSRSCRWPPATWPGPPRVLDLGCGEGQIARLAVAGGAARVVGVDPSAAQIAEARRRGRRRGLRPGLGRRPAVRGRHRSTPWSPAWCWSTSSDLDGALDEVARVLRPGGRFVMFVNHPLFQTPGSGWIDDQVLDPPEQYWRVGPVPARDGDGRGGRRRACGCRSSTARSAATSTPWPTGACTYPHGRAGAAAAGSWPGAAEYTDAATIPRLLLLRAERR